MLHSSVRCHRFFAASVSGAITAAFALSRGFFQAVILVLRADPRAARMTRTASSTVRLEPPQVLPARDYVSPNLQTTWPDAAFPSMTVGDPGTCGWPYLRRDVPHNW